MRKQKTKGSGTAQGVPRKPRKPRKSRSRVAQGLPDRRLAKCADCKQHVGVKNLFRVRGRDRICMACGQPAIAEFSTFALEPLR
jgi:hypothetical protein